MDSCTQNCQQPHLSETSDHKMSAKMIMNQVALIVTVKFIASLERDKHTFSIFSQENWGGDCAFNKAWV